ncbi:hypothetical protein [Miltoncostaea marina]|uniref:hypothetical protein n=1 Tax=Miltoncostaea marina TaxID=2843215 RepID=UPI001C3C8CE4|nr:hypothetical protein [Miltoncostaea marina]
MERRARGGPRAGAAAAAAAVIAALAAAGCGGEEAAVPDAGAATAPATTAPAAPATTAPDPAPTGDPRVVTRRVGAPGRDGAITFTVRRIAASAPIRVPFAAPLRAPAGRRLLVAVVDLRNHSGAVADPFCGGGGARLVDRRGREYEPHRRVYVVPGNRTCTGIRRGRTVTETLPFVVPAGARVAELRLWDNRQTADFLGEGHVRVLP